MIAPADPSQEPAPAGEWLYRQGAQVYGPIPGTELAAMIDRGELDGSSPVAGPDGAFRPAAEVKSLAVRVRLAEARRRVEAEQEAVRQARRRRVQLRVGLVLLVALVAAAGAGAVAFRLSRERPWERRSALLSDFGAGIVLSVPVRVGGARAPGGGEVELPAEEARRRDRDVGGAAVAAGGAVAGSPARGGLVEQRWDEAHIQSVVAREQQELAPCLRAEAERAPGWSGEIPIEFAIGNDGRVAQLWIDGERRGSAPLRECLTQAMARWTFRPFPGERAVVSLSFRVGTR